MKGVGVGGKWSRPQKTILIFVIDNSHFTQANYAPIEFAIQVSRNQSTSLQYDRITFSLSSTLYYFQFLVCSGKNCSYPIWPSPKNPLNQIS